jgi:CubicO group peptidase (beta-lactamase class C family)
LTASAAFSIVEDTITKTLRGRNMRAFNYAAAVAAALALASCAVVDVRRPAAPAAEQAHASGLSAERLGRLDSAFEAYVADGRLAGAVIHISHKGETVYSRAFGWRDIEAADPMKEDTIFRIASQTKAMVSVAIMMLQEEGRLLIEDPVGKHLPEWSRTTVATARADGGYDVAPARRPITIRDLLTHTSGVSYGTGPAEKAWREAGIFGWYFADRDEPVSAVVARMAALPMAAQPGEQWVYGYSTDILGVIVEKVSGQSLEAFLNERLIGPLGMKDTHFYLPESKSGRLANVYSPGADGLTRAPAPGAWVGSGFVGQGHHLSGPRKAFSGGAGLLATASDYARFLEMLRRGGEMDGRRFLSRNSVALMTRNHLNGVAYQPGAGFGLGFRIITDPGVNGRPGSQGEYSWGGAYHSTYWVDPEEDLTVVFLTQLIPAGTIDDHGKLRALIYQALD